MGCDDCGCCDNQPVTYLRQVERNCINCGQEIAYIHSFSSGEVNGRTVWWHLVCAGEAA